VTDVGDGRNQECRSFFEKSGTNRIRITFLLGQLNKILEISHSEAGLKVEKSGGVFGEEGECRDVFQLALKQGPITVYVI